MPTREQEYSAVRRHLARPKEQAPSPDDIISGLIRQEQLMLNRLNNTGRPWTIDRAEFTTSAGEAEYSILNAGAGSFGKALYAYRILDSGQLMPVPFTDYLSEVNNQSYDFRVAPYDSGIGATYAGEKLAFFRTSAGETKVRVYPVPTEAITFYVQCVTGALDATVLTMGDSPVLPEWSDYRTLAVALFELPKAEWEGYSMEQNIARRKELKANLETQLLIQTEQFEQFVRNPQIDQPETIGYWWE